MEYIKKKDFIIAEFSDTEVYIFTAKVKDILPIYYVAVRGRDDDDGAVQRMLNKRRISSIADFVLDGNMFFNTFIMNWVDTENEIISNNNEIKIPISNKAAQVIDGQHRLEGLKVAYNKEHSIGEKEIIIIMAQSLTTKEAAKIFLNINSEQKPVPPSLVYDLFGEIKDKDYNVARARDIVIKMHNDISSAYYQCIKLPGAKQGIGKVDLSATISKLKTYLEPNGLFYQYNLSDFETQYKVIYNFTNVLRYYYDIENSWLKNDNPFLTNAGYFSMVRFLCEDLLPKCVAEKSFEEKTIKMLFPLDSKGLLKRQELKDKQGKEQRTIVYNYLKSILLTGVPQKNEYRF